MAPHLHSILVMGIMLAILLSGCLEQVPTKNSVISESSACSQQVHQENEVFTILQGEPFTYNGMIPLQGIHAVRIEVGSPFRKNPLVSESVPVNDDGTFIFTMNRSRTQELGRIFLAGENSAPYHVSLNFTTTERHFYLNIVQIPADLQGVQSGKWISINPFHKEKVSGEFRNVIRDFSVDGTTNLPEGDEVIITIMSTSDAPCQMYKPSKNYISRCGEYLEEKVRIRNGTCGENTWSFTMNTSYYRFSDPEYIVYVHSFNKSRNYRVWDSKIFRTEPDNPYYQDPNEPRVIDTYGSRK